MGFGYTNLGNGLEIVSKSTSANSVLGDLEVLTSTNKIYFYNGTTNSPLVTESGTATLTSKTMDGGSNTFTNIPGSAFSTTYVAANGTVPLTANWSAGAFTITANSVAVGSAANTISGLATIDNGSGVFTLNTSGNVTVPNITDTLVGLAASQTLTNKTLTTPVIATVDSGSGTFTFNTSGAVSVPNGNDTVVTLTATQTLTNKTLTSASLTTPTIDVTNLTEQASTPSNPSAGTLKFYAGTNNNLYTVNSSGVVTQITPGSGGTTNAVAPRFTLSGATIPFTCIDGTFYVTTTNSVASVNISMLNSGTSGSTTVQINQYRSGVLQGSATASLSASSGNPTGSNASLSSTLSVLSGDLLSCDVNSIASGLPSELSVQPVFS